ncbi:MAG: ABC transporter permease [Arachnia sp.]
MRLTDLLASSLSSLWQRKFRSALTILGVIVGTIAVVVMVSLGVGMSATMLAGIEDQTNLRQVSVWQVPADPETGQDRLLDDDMVAELSQLPGVTDTWPVYSIPVGLSVNGYEIQTEIIGMPNDALQALEADYSSGGPPEQGAPFTVIVGDHFSELFFDEATLTEPDIDIESAQLFLTLLPDFDACFTGECPPSEEGTPVAGRLPIVPAGVIATDDQSWTSYSMALLADLDAMMPAWQKAYPGNAMPNQPTTASGAPTSQFVYDEVRLVTAELQEAEELTTALRADGYEVQSELEWIRGAQEQAALAQAVLGGIAFISLFVAAIGIANTMLMSVYERTREIGIIKVLGARLRDIRRMFLFESAAIGFIGGTSGVILSSGISTGINAVVGPHVLPERRRLTCHDLTDTLVAQPWCYRVRGADRCRGRDHSGATRHQAEPVSCDTLAVTPEPLRAIAARTRPDHRPAAQ